MSLAGPEVLGHSSPAPALLPLLFPTWVGGRQAPLSGGPSWGGPPSVDSGLLPSFLPMSLGPQPPPLSSEDCAENGPLGLLRTLTVCLYTAG